jgi:Protein of unknown function (DUF3060)
VYSVQSVQTTGKNNVVRYSGRRPTFQDTGEGNELTFQSGASSQDTSAASGSLHNGIEAGKSGVNALSDVRVDVVGAAAPGTYDCHGHNARILGMANNITLKQCKVVLVNGSSNVVRIIDPKAIKLYGTNNHVTWTGDQKPIVDVLGLYNSIRHQ